ncbi:hypothetical protein B7435_15150 [Mycolicibacterium peregrinum]|uniref:hypothetical protein n=1 Tax=Mycolicibacterium peregrinum TaxID=43304 RepID=UPI0006D843A4|nr:hypothetical protein [Mycolicibacterium peregrinum]MCV7206609.1 hypothetical protein [Mycolicibacterium peregrinum]ORW54262.1 hypothetical protein AWC21_25360 [Mycolicibacterium peregrinum]OWM02220.1 hypothetical protein B7435_15150 [Mycolicibacterium peregrinum]
MNSRVNSRVSSGLTACVAVATAGVVAITPVAVSTPTPTRVLDASTALMASFEGMNQAGLVFMAGQRLADQFVQAPLTPFVLAAQLVAGDNERLFSQIRQIVDSPVYVADPLIEAIAITLPAEFGGGSDHVTNTSAGDGTFMQFRNNELLGLRDDINAQFAQVLDVDTPWPNDNYTAALAQGLQESAVRSVNGAVLGAVGLVSVAQAVASGDKLAVYKAVKEYIDAPMWVADPAIEGLAEALPAGLGGGTNHDPTDPTGDGTLMQFRNNQLIGARDSVRIAAANVLGVRDKVDSTGNVIASNSLNRSQSLSATDDKSDQKPKVNNLKPHVTNLNAALDGAKGKAEKRREKAKANVDKVVKKVREAADKTAKKLGSKKGSED